MKHIARIILLSLLVVCLMQPSNSQSTIDSTATDTLSVKGDTVDIKKKKGSIFNGKPGKAMIMSLIIPGTGQIYNKSYLRVPFVWGAVGGMGYLVYDNTVRYNCLSDAYVASIDNVPYTFPEDCKQCQDYVGITNSAQLKAIRDEVNNNRQLSIVGLSMVWIMNGIDAFVNAHLKEFEVNEDLSIDFGSRMDNDPNSPMRLGIFVQF